MWVNGKLATGSIPLFRPFAVGVNDAARQGDQALVEKYYRMALDVDDLFFPAKQNLAVLLSQRGSNDEAERLLRKILDEYAEQRVGYDIKAAIGNRRP